MKVGKIAVLGGGAWGTALAQVQASAGRETVLWLRDAAMAEAVNRNHENPAYLPGEILDPRLRAVINPRQALEGASIILAAIPAQALRDALQPLAPALDRQVPLVLCCKGIERSTGMLPSAVAAAAAPGNPVAVLSGPSFAADVVRGLPTAVTVAAADPAMARKLAQLLASRQFRCYSSHDLAGVEAGGALKNVLAIAAGIVAGRGLGSSAQAALITRGFVELRRMALALGGQPETVMGLSGLGDLILTCGSEKSRNFAYGAALGRGASVEGLPLAEGVATAGIAARLAREHAIQAPIVDAVSRILDGALGIDAAIDELLNRPLRAETE